MSPSPTYDRRGYERLPQHVPAGEERDGYWLTLCGRWAPHSHLHMIAHEDCPACVRCGTIQRERSTP